MQGGLSAANDDIVLVSEPLRSIIDAGNVEKLREYVAKHPNVDLAQPYDSFRIPSLAHRAVELRHVKLLEFLVLEGGVDVNVPGLHGATLLHVAARRGFAEVVKLLLNSLGADVNSMDKLGWTPLHDAAMEGHPKLVRYLVQHNAAISIATNDGQTAEALARSNSSGELGDAATRRAARISNYLSRIAGHGGFRSWLAERRMAFVKLRWLAEQQRAVPILVYAKEQVSLARFMFPNCTEPPAEEPPAEEAANGLKRPNQPPFLPIKLLPLVLRFLVPLDDQGGQQKHLRPGMVYRKPC